MMLKAYKKLKPEYLEKFATPETTEKQEKEIQEFIATRKKNTVDLSALQSSGGNGGLVLESAKLLHRPKRR